MAPGKPAVPSNEQFPTEEIRYGEAFTIKAGESIIFGRDPKAADYADTSGSRLLKLASETVIEDNLSRAAVKIILGDDGRLNVENLSASNEVLFYHPDFENPRGEKITPLYQLDTVSTPEFREKVLAKSDIVIEMARGQASVVFRKTRSPYEGVLPNGEHADGITTFTSLRFRVASGSETKRLY